MNIEDELAQAKEELEAIKAEYQEYVYVVSHDLIAPLRQIEGFAQIVHTKHADKFDEKTNRHFDLIVSGAEKGRNILDALLDYSRLSTRAKPVSSVNCQEVIDEVTSELSALIEGSGAQIACTEIPVIIADSKQVYQIFYHLIHNALHYQFAGNSPRISIEAIENEHDWQFCVKDNGMGVPDHLTDKIFTILRRAVTDKEYSGIGMGLAVTRQIVHRHGGRIWIVSEKNIGSSFNFTITKDLQCD